MLDFTKCSLCGSCVEACRDGAIRFSREYNLASTSKEDFIMDLFKRLEDEARAAEGPGASAPAVAVPAATAAPGTSSAPEPAPASVPQKPEAAL
jgi:NADH-quinone oxidoreductase subunit I